MKYPASVVLFGAVFETDPRFPEEKEEKILKTPYEKVSKEPFVDSKN